METITANFALIQRRKRNHKFQKTQLPHPSNTITETELSYYNVLGT